MADTLDLLTIDFEEVSNGLFNLQLELNRDFVLENPTYLLDSPIMLTLHQNFHFQSESKLTVIQISLTLDYEFSEEIVKEICLENTEHYVHDGEFEINL